MKEIKLIIPERGEKLSSNAADIHKELLKLPAGMYVDLYHIMKNKMENSNRIITTISGGITTSPYAFNTCCGN